MIEFISVMFRALTGMRLTPETVIILGFFFALGWLFGKLTRRIGIIKGVFLAIFGSVALVFLSVAPGVIVFFFIAGVLTNHGPLLARVIYWAQDIADIFYALQYRQAFEDIRAEEARMEEEIRQARADAYAAPMRVERVPPRTDGASRQGVDRKNPVLMKKKKQGMELVGRRNHPGDRLVRQDRRARSVIHSGTNTCRPWG